MLALTNWLPTNDEVAPTTYYAIYTYDTQTKYAAKMYFGYGHSEVHPGPNVWEYHKPYYFGSAEARDRWIDKAHKAWGVQK